MRQSSKTGTLKITNPQSLELAGTIKSTSEVFVGESDGRYALSTSASTTITNAQNLYPELWNRAPAGWQSGSDLVVPAQNNLEYTENIELNLNDGDLTDVGTEILDLNFFNLKGFRKGKSISISFELGFDCTASGANGFDSVNIPLSLFPFLSGLTGISGDGIFVSNVNGLIDGVNSPGVYRQVTGKIVISGSNLNCGFFGDFYSATNRVASGTMFFHFNEDGTTDTPYIHLYDSVAAGALGLPEATADVSGIVSTGTQTFAGHKTFTEITSTTYNNLPAAGASSSGVVKKAFFLAQGGAQQTITGTASALNLDPPLFNEGFSVSGANNETIAVNNAGVYKISAHVTFNFLGTTESVRIEIRAGGARRSTTTTGAPDGSAVVSAVSFTMVELNANDTIVINVIMSSGSATTLTSRNDYTQVIIERMNA